MDVADETQQGKRKRVVTACDTCRKSKIKCDGELPHCSRCARIKIDCVYTPVTRKNVPAKRTKLIEGLEDRLNRIESFVMSDLVSESLDMKAGNALRERHSPTEPNGRTIASTHSYPSRPAPTPIPAKTKPSRSSLADNTTTPVSESSGLTTAPVEAKSTEFLHTDLKGQSHYIGSASGFSIFSPKGIAWINEKVGDARFMSIISSAKGGDCSEPGIYAEISTRRLYQRLPSKEETRALLKEFFNFQHVYPLYHESTFMSLFETHFTQEYDEARGPGWWASLNMLLAIAHRIRVLRDLTLQDEEDKASLYFKNAMAVLTDLLLRIPHILNVQALLAMAYYSQGSSCVELSCFLGSAAVRLSQNMGMHRESPGAELSPRVAEERREVFWIGYILDKNTSLRFGRPPDQDDDDTDIQLPAELPDAPSTRLPNLFRAMCALAKIEGQVYKRLYSVKASRQPIEEIVKAVNQLDQELGDWRQSVPEEYKPESEIKISDDVLRQRVVNFHLAYYHCLAAIHRKLVQHGHWVCSPDPSMEDADQEKFRQQVFSSAALCVSAARASINLIRFVPQGNLVCIWIMLCYVVMSFLALCVNIYQNPEDPKAKLDLKLMKIVTNFLSLLRNDETGEAAHHILDICAEFERLAQRAVKYAQEKQPSDRAYKQTPLSYSASSYQATPTSTSTSDTTSSFPPDLGPSVSRDDGLGNGMLMEPSGYPTFGAAELPKQESSLPFGCDLGYASQPIGTGTEEMNFNGSTILPEFTGAASPSEFWQLPMPFEWNWADMTANHFPTD